MKYKALIGLEMHCEMKSNRKVFSPSKNEYNEEANVNVSLVDLAFPGILPVVNKECVKKALKMSLALNAQTPDYFYFERKNYYYPDLPKGYQITQETKPIPAGIYGEFKFLHNGIEKKVRINNLHLEEDSASLTHLDNKSLINYNRVGVPLLELVTEPDLHSADEACSFLEEMRRVYRYLDISEADTKKGQIRCDVNVSIMDSNLDELNPNNYGTRVEIKNVNSFSGVRDAINYEINRQIEMKENGTYDSLEQETRRWDEESQTTKFMRGKVDAIDYKYFVDPNIPKFKVSKELLKSIKESIPKLPLERYYEYINLNIPSSDAEIIIKEKGTADYFEECVSLGIEPITAMNWLNVQILGYLNKENIAIEDFYLKPAFLKQIIDEINKGNLSSKLAKEIFSKSINEKKEPREFFNDNKQISDEDEITKIIDNVLLNNEENVNLFKEGRTNLFDYFVGQVMKETRGKANPIIVKEILNEKLKK